MLSDHFYSPFGALRVKTLARAVALAVASAAVTGALAQVTPVAEEAAPRAKDDTVRLGTITIIGKGDKLGAGQILNEDATKGRSTVTKDATEKDRATGNSYPSSVGKSKTTPTERIFVAKRDES